MPWERVRLFVHFLREQQSEHMRVWGNTKALELLVEIDTVHIARVHINDLAVWLDAIAVSQSSRYVEVSQSCVDAAMAPRLMTLSTQRASGDAKDNRIVISSLLTFRFSCPQDSFA